MSVLLDSLTAPPPINSTFDLPFSESDIITMKATLVRSQTPAAARSQLRASTRRGQLARALRLPEPLRLRPHAPSIGCVDPMRRSDRRRRRDCRAMASSSGGEELRLVRLLETQLRLKLLGSGRMRCLASTPDDLRPLLCFERLSEL